MSKKKIIIASGLVVIISVILTSSTFAATGSLNRGMMRGRLGTDFKMAGKGIIGTVSAVNGSSITVNSNGLIYTVDATNAKIKKGLNSFINISDIVVGDKVAVRGTINGTNITATNIMDGVGIASKENHFMGTVTSVNGSSFVIQVRQMHQVVNRTVNINSNTVLTKNNQPASVNDLAVNQKVLVVGTLDSSSNINAAKVDVIVRMPSINFTGTVQSISGNVLTVLASNGTTYTVDVTNANVGYKRGHKGSISIIAVNDKVMIVGQTSTSANNITAKMIRDLSKSAK